MQHAQVDPETTLRVLQARSAILRGEIEAPEDTMIHYRAATLAEGRSRAARFPGVVAPADRYENQDLTDQELGTVFGDRGAV